MRNRPLWLLAGGAVAVAIVLYAVRGGQWLVINSPQKSDVILVLDGDTQYRPMRGVELLSRGYGSHLLLDVPSDNRVYNLKAEQIARQYIATLSPSIAERTKPCPVRALSTDEEAHSAERCLRALGARSVLLVTSDYHSRRALATFRHVLPSFQFSVASCYDPVHYGTQWWLRREWTKWFLAETTKFAWFEMVDRWRN